VKSVGAPTACSVIRLADWPEGGYVNADRLNPKIGMRRGEVLVGGPTVSIGYLVDDANPDPEVLSKNQDWVTIAGIRYFRTGDIGQVTFNGNLMIIDRKKDLWKGPQGEYVALSRVEAAIKLSPFVEIPMVYGRTGGAFVVALVCVVEQEVRRCADRCGLTGDPAHLCRHAAVVQEVAASCREYCRRAGLADFEIPRRFALFPPLDGIPQWTPENDFLTAAMKLKRHRIVRGFQTQIDSLYT